MLSVCRVGIDAISTSNALAVDREGNLRGCVDRDARLNPEEAVEAITNADAFLRLAQGCEAEKSVARYMEVVTLMAPLRNCPTIILSMLRQSSGAATQEAWDRRLSQPMS
jgi:hypothetical protein